ncbi:MAG: dynamin family protein [Verrucomicrobiaceae bacterium]|nr:dynamin family protein [Verrucomicrobiaceae bacterium]
MIGDDYFDLRSRLGAELFALSGLVRELGGGQEQAAIIDNLIAGLRDPFVFVVVGEVNVGKSTFLNALFGQEFSRTGVMPTTDKIYFFKHGPQVAVRALTPTLEEVQVPCDFLRDFHIVDTPGTNSIENEHQQITERFVPNADLVVFVFSAMNPWGASAWQFLEKVHRQWMRNVVFVLQQADLRSPEELQVIVDYMAQLSRQRFGRDFPLFAVSAKKAFLARSSAADPERLLAESGFAALESYISGSVTNNPARLAKLVNAHRFARQILDQLTVKIDATVDAARRKRTLIDELQAERAMQGERTLKKLTPALDATTKDYHDAAVKIAGMSEELLSLKTATQPETEDSRGLDSLDHRLFQEIMFRVGERWRHVAAVVEEDHRQFTRYLHAQARGHLYLAPLDEARDIDDPAVEMRRRFVARIESTLRRFVIGLKLDEAVEPALLSARKRARLIPWAAALAVIAAGTAWWFGGLAPALLALGCGALLTLGAWLLARSSLIRTRRLLRAQLEDSGDTLHTMLAGQISEDTEHTFSRFLTILTPARDEALLREEHLLSQAAPVAALRDSFERLERELQAATAQ